MTENKSEYGLVDLFVYNKYMKTNRPKIEIEVAEYATTSEELLVRVIWRDSARSFLFFICFYYFLSDDIV
jgi:uncharacterized protein (DUF111 family)